MSPEADLFGWHFKAKGEVNVTISGRKNWGCTESSGEVPVCGELVSGLRQHVASSRHRGSVVSQGVFHH